MENIKQIMLKRMRYLEKVEKELISHPVEAPEGRLRISKQGNCAVYYIKQKGSPKSTYLHREEDHIAKALAQRDYQNTLQQRIQRELGQLRQFLNTYDHKRVDGIMDHYSPMRRALVDPLVMSDDAYATWWETEPYEAECGWEEEKKLKTKKGDLTRSKSELMIANFYYDHNIPYRYECELRLKNGKRRYPDFTVLNRNTREVFYHEHLGLIDQTSYLEKNLIKLEEYQSNGIFLGKNLILTYETKDHPFNLYEVEAYLLHLAQ
ncbi:MAG: hypothetical protein K6G04_08190 [Lachnospiraceae bacterium]|nr:hypothetical protein [Lachnospiraceae bacterium]